MIPLRFFCGVSMHGFVMEEKKKKLVIIGGGFGGLNLAKYLDKKKWDVTLVDKQNYHSFAPLFYQVASASLEPAGITFPLRREMRKRRTRGCQYTMGTVSVIDVSRKQILTEFETIPYDTLVIAAGATNNFFGIPGLDQRVYTIKSAPESIRARNAVLYNLERASQCEDEHERRKLLTFAVVGGGPTGVEIAGALGEMKRWTIIRDYPRIKPDEVNVVLYEGTDKLLRTMSEASSKDALKALEQLMVDVRLGKTMKAYEDGVLKFSDGETLETNVVIWTAGITGQPFTMVGTDVKPGPGGRFQVDEFNRVKGLDDVYTIGDISCHVDNRFPRGCPQLAQPAIQQGRTLAKNLNADAPHIPFSYKDKGSMATIGRNRAVVDMGKLHFDGWFAWITWLAVHLVTLLGMRNKFVVLLNWIWNYFGFSTSLRLILKPTPLPKTPVTPPPAVPEPLVPPVK